MSYLISLAVQKQPDGKYKAGNIGTFGGLHWELHKDNLEYIKYLNSTVLKVFNTSGEDYYVTTEEKLRTAPVDEVIIIEDELNWSTMSNKNRNPVENKEQRQISEFL